MQGADIDVTSASYRKKLRMIFQKISHLLRFRFVKFIRSSTIIKSKFNRSSSCQASSPTPVDPFCPKSHQSDLRDQKLVASIKLRDINNIYNIIL